MLDRGAVRDRQRAGQRDIDRGGLRVGRRAEGGRRAREDLAPRRGAAHASRCRSTISQRHSGVSVGTRAVPVGRLLVAVGDVRAAALREKCLPVSCSPTGSPASSKPQGIESAGRPASGALTVKMSPRYICTGSSLLAPSSKAVLGVVGPRITSQRSNAALEVARDEPPHLLRLEVIGVVIAVRQHVGADQDAPLHLGAEALGARARIHVEQVGVALRAVAVAHAVEAREVGRGFRRRDHVVHRNAELLVGQLDRHRRRALAGEPAHRFLDRLAHARLDALAEVLARQTDAQARAAPRFMSRR